MLALKLFEVGRLSSGKAGKLCSMAGGNFSSPPGVPGCPWWRWMVMS